MNIEGVVEKDLCHGCGTCAAICPSSAISMSLDDKQGIFLPLIDQSKCSNCSDCFTVCPGHSLDLDDRHWDTNKLKTDPLVGPYLSIWKCHSTDNQIRQRASSGGAITSILKHLFHTNRIDAAIVVRMNPEEPTKAEAYIAQSFEEIWESQKSKYCPVPLNEILQSVKSNSSTYAYVGLPNHVHGLRNMQKLIPSLKTKIPYVISLFTAHTPSQNATNFILYKNNINPNQVREMEYRGGGNPGRMLIKLKSGEDIIVPHFHWTYSGHSFPLFFYPIREWLYFDKMSEWADISCGDNWQDGLSNQKGDSSIIVRCEIMNEIIKEMSELGSIKLSPMSTDDLILDQGLKKKLNIRDRLIIWRKLGNSIPSYTRKFEKIPISYIRTIRFAAYVKLSNIGLSYRFMNAIIWSDYYFRALPQKYIRKIKTFVKYIIKALHITKIRKSHGHNKKIILIGGYGYLDIGDEAMPHAMRLKLREKFGDDIKITMLSVNPRLTREFHNEDSTHDFRHLSYPIGRKLKYTLAGPIFISLVLFAALIRRFGFRVNLWKSANAALEEIGGAVALVNVGGGNLNSIMPGELYKKCTTYLVCRILNVPVFVSGQTIGPFTYRCDRWFAKLALNSVNVLTFRDKETSMQRVKQIGVIKPKMYDAADDAITLPAITVEKSIQLIEGDLACDFKKLSSRKIIYLNVKASLKLFKGADRIASLDIEAQKMSTIADLIVSEYNYNVVLFSSDFSEGVDDRVIHRKIKSIAKNKQNIFVLENEYSDVELIGLLSLGHAAIGGRYHFNVFAAALEIPFLGVTSGLYQMTKLQGLANLCDLPECYFEDDMEFCDIEYLSSRVRQFLNDEDAIRTKLEIASPKLKLQSKLILEDIAQVLPTKKTVI